MDINIEQIKIKNFLSFGSKWQTVPFLCGLNVIIGEDEDTGRSNGAGKSSLMESIPFALFGQVHRNIKKEQIVNWKNRKACEVQLDFLKRDDRFRVVRGIKPNVFEIYKNGQLINKPSHVREYQAILDDILGLNFTTFMSLIHSNINSSMKILSMSKPEKRKFLEKMFGLSLYTKLNEESNAKLKRINEKKREIEISNNYKEKAIVESEERVADLYRQLRSFKVSKKLLEEAEERLTEIEEKAPVTDKNDLNKKIEESLFILSENESLVSKIESKIVNVKYWIRDNNEKIADYNANKEDLKERQKNIDNLNNFINEHGSSDELTEKIEGLKTDIGNCEFKIERTIEKIGNIKSDIATVVSEINQKKIDIDLLKNDKCPTCGSDLSDGYLLRTKEEELREKYKEDGVLRFSLKSCKENDREELHVEKSNLLKEIYELEDKRNNIYNLKNKIVDVVGSDVNIDKLKKNKLRYNDTLDKLKILLSGVKEKVIRENRNYSLLEEEKEELQNYINRISEQEIKIQKIEEKIENEQKLKDNLTLLIEKDEENVKKLSKEMKSSELSVVKYNEMKDYLDAIKIVCKDENVKQYAISSIMPFLNRYTNKYLSKVGYGFYVTLDKWLEATINGPGITKASYGSLSGGEGRGIDIAIQLAFIDIDRLQAGVIFDLLVFDELLDSSIDASGIKELFDIVKTKQKEDDSKVFIISHRKELKDYDEIDNEYFIRKKDGYSEVIIK